ncbi:MULTISPECIES: FxsA family protein [Paenibacillus]|uniref:FxsA family protein n=1 Tax=Paenibacillus TaxID=44249 RepID=UPI001F233F97|nr:FxsA family protein [Paenibacillus sp. JJ-223]CAH1226028.1 hypothetical protein PAECIP111890_05881 [Paenibacillus sp. JJ-223]
MRRWMWGILLIVPVIELFGFIVMSDWIGAGKTLLLMLLTSLIGIAMLQFEGRKVLYDARAEMERGQVPGRKMVDGLLVFVGGFLLLIPGFVTDLIGFTLVFPITRAVYRLFFLGWLEKKMKNGSITFYRRR